MKNILVPTDFSENCTKAAHLGIKMAKLYKAEIHFLHLLKTPVDWVKLDKQKEKRYPETLKKIGIARAALRELEKTAEREGLKCRRFLQFDAGQGDILDHSKHYHHDFIITESSCTKGVIREITGSNVEEIVRKANAPVIVVKDEPVSFPFKDIVFVSDFKFFSVIASEMAEKSNVFSATGALSDSSNRAFHILNISKSNLVSPSEIPELISLNAELKFGSKLDNLSKLNNTNNLEILEYPDSITNNSVDANTLTDIVDTGTAVIEYN